MCKRPRPPRAHATGGPRSGGAGPTGRTATPGRGSVLAGQRGEQPPPWPRLAPRGPSPCLAERETPQTPPVGARGPGPGRVLSVFAVLSGTSVPAGKGGSSVTGRGSRPSSAAPWSGRRLTLQALCRRLHAGAARSLPTRASCVPRGPAWDPSLCGSPCSRRTVPSVCSRHQAPHAGCGVPAGGRCSVASVPSVRSDSPSLHWLCPRSQPCPCWGSGVSGGGLWHSPHLPPPPQTAVHKHDPSDTAPGCPSASSGPDQAGLPVLHARPGPSV